MGNTDFTGFSFGNWHSDDCNIIRVSSGDRYTEQLHPEIKDKTVEVPGMNGSYYFGSDYGTRQFDIEIAFDHLTEEQFRELRKTFGTKEIKKLIFDERPYKYYMAKLASPIELSYVCFDEPKRIQKFDSDSDSTTWDDGVRVDHRETARTLKVDVCSDGLEVIVGTTFNVDDGNYSFIYSSTDDSWRLDDGDEFPEVDLSNYGVAVQLPSQENVVDNTELEDSIESNEESNDESVVAFFTITIYTYVSEVVREKINPWVYETDNMGSIKYERIYKGEGTINLIAYFPFAKSRYKTLPENTDSSDWAISSGILSESEAEGIDTYKNFSGTTNGFETYNPGDLSTGFYLYCPFNTSQSLQLIYQKEPGSDTAALKITEMTPQTNNTNSTDIGFIIDTNTGLIYGVTTDPGELTSNIIKECVSNNIYNQYIVSGYFFKLEPNLTTDSRSRIIITKEDGTAISLTNANIQIYYDYLYF